MSLSVVTQPEAPEVVAAKRILRHFNEAAYLQAHPDVATACANKTLANGRAHFEAFGMAEGRRLGPTRRQRMIRGIEVGIALGVEIGPLMTPIVEKSDGAILYVDHVDTATLREKYAKDQNVDVTRIVPVDVVWNSGQFKHAFAPDFKADYVLASHVVEHVPDLIRWLGDIRDVLKPDGLLRLAVPDRRYTFDFLRRETELHDILAAYVEETKVPTPQVVLDHCLNYRPIDTVAMWLGQLRPETLRPSNTIDAAVAFARDSYEHGRYVDVHCWVFTPSSFARLMAKATAAGLINFACADFSFPMPFDNDFVVGLRPSTSASEMVESWQRMLAAALENAE